MHEILFHEEQRKHYSKLILTLDIEPMTENCNCASEDYQNFPQHIYSGYLHYVH